MSTDEFDIIFVLGPSGAGKSALCAAWQGQDPDIEVVDDLEVVEELLDVDSVLETWRARFAS